MALSKEVAFCGIEMQGTTNVYYDKAGTMLAVVCHISSLLYKIDNEEEYEDNSKPPSHWVVLKLIAKFDTKNCT